MNIGFKFILLVFLILSTTLFANKKPNVLILHSYNQSFKWTNDINKGINSILKHRVTEIKLFVEYMDTKKYVDDTHYKNLFNTYVNKYEDINFDLIISSDNNAFNFLKKYHKTLFKSSPVVFSGLNYLKKEDLNGLSNFTGIGERADIKQNYELIKKLHPNIKNIYTIIDSTTTGQLVKEEAKRVTEELARDGINYHIIEDITFEELKTKVKNLPSNSAILLSVFFKGKDNRSFEYYEISQMISENSSSVLYALWDFNLGHGIIGGYLTSGLFQGKEAALMGLEILDGKKIENIPVKYKSPNSYMFDFNELIKHKISLDLLPKDSYIINKPISFYEIYKKEIITIIFLFLFMFLLIVLLLINIQKRKSAEKRIKEQLVFEQTLIDTVNTPIYYKDKKGKYIGCNKAFENHIEREKAEIIGKTVYDVLPLETAQVYNSRDNELLQNGKSQKYEGIQKFSDGNIKDLIFYKDVFYDDKKHIAGFVGAIFDITKLKKATNEVSDLNKSLEQKVSRRTFQLAQSNNELEQTITNLKQTRDKLIESEKMASLGGLVAGVAHEINTPVGVGLTGITYLLKITEDIKENYLSDNISQEEFEKYLDTSNELATQVNNNLERTAHLVRSFKQLATDQTSEEKREFELKQYLEDIILSLNNTVKKTNLSIEIRSKEDITINSYPGAYAQIVTNLILNSIRHAYDEKEQGVITIDLLRQNDHLEITYKDDGKGISKDNLPKIFEPFFTTNREQGGTGLGLNVVYNSVANNLHGTIECESKEGFGVMFKIVIPLT